MIGGGNLRELRRVLYTETRTAWREWQQWRQNYGDQAMEKQLRDRYMELHGIIVAAHCTDDYDEWVELIYHDM